MKMFYVWYDIAVGPGNIKEQCMSVYTTSKSKAISKYHDVKPKNAIFRCCKANAIS